MADETRRPAGNDEDVSVYRPVVQVIARLIATDRRAALLASESGRILLANAPAKALGLGSAPLPQVFGGQGSLAPEDDWPDLVARARRAGSVRVCVNRGGQPLEGELVALPVGPATGFFLRLSDSEDEATWLRNRARAATLLRVAHDLRTPIQSLLASAEGLIAGDTPEPGALARLRRAADLSLQHVSNVLSVLRGEQRGSGLQPDTAFSAAQELDALIAVLHPVATARGAEIRLSSKVSGPEPLVGPVRFVRALFQNMLDNAVKYGGPEIEVTLRQAPLPAAPEGSGQGADAPLQEVLLEVRDLGGGLPQAQRDRLEAALGLAAEGGGIAPEAGTAKSVEGRASSRPSGGLDVLAHALLQLGGKLEVEDRLGSGAAGEGAAGVIGTVLRARFSLPADTAAAADPMPPAPRPAAADSRLQGARILLVEDSPASRTWLCQVLRNAGAEVTAAGSGPEALGLLAEEGADRIELVLSDVTLPGMHGVELARRIRARSGPGIVPGAPRIVGLTAHADDRIRAACLKAGMVAVLEKPIRPGELCTALGALRAPAVSGPEPQDSTRAPKRAPTPSTTPAATPATTPAPAQAPRRGAPAGSDPLLDADVVAELESELGRDRARAFMTRALAEAEQALAAVRAGVGETTACTLHAATGACGLTGLALVERRLRALEDAVKAGAGDLAADLGALEAAVQGTGARLRGAAG